MRDRLAPILADCCGFYPRGPGVVDCLPFLLEVLHSSVRVVLPIARGEIEDIQRTLLIVRRDHLPNWSSRVVRVKIFPVTRKQYVE